LSVPFVSPSLEAQTFQRLVFSFIKPPSITQPGDEPSPMSRIPRARVLDETSGTVPSQSITENAGDNGHQRRPGFEEPCLGALQEFRRGRIDGTSATTKIAIAIPNGCILSAEEEPIYRRYFGILDRYANELRAASSETQIAIETSTREKSPQSLAWVDKETALREKPKTAASSHKHTREKGKQRAEICADRSQPPGKSAYQGSVPRRW